MITSAIVIKGNFENKKYDDSDYQMIDLVDQEFWNL